MDYKQKIDMHRDWFSLFSFTITMFIVVMAFYVVIKSFFAIIFTRMI